MAQLSTPPISAKTYRHFAVVTVAVTVLLAVFADGENRQALSDGVAERQEAARLQAAQVEKFGKPKLVARHKTEGDGWGYQGYGDSYDSDYGKPMDGSGFTSASVTWKGRANPNAAVPGAYAPYGISQAEWNAMSDEEREAFLRKRTRPQPVVTAAQHQRQVDGLLAASAARAGQADEDGDI